MESPVYISGPMTGIEDFNFPLFNKAADELKLTGYSVINPAEMDDGDTRQNFYYYMRRDLPHVFRAKSMVVLPGWERSRGARVEVTLAQALAIPVYDYETMRPIDQLQAEDDGPKPGTVLEEAQRLVYGTRCDSYGHPIDDFSTIAALWTPILGTDVTPRQIGLCMIALKLARELYRPKRDNRVDIAGYAETLERLEEKRGD